jgi:hypothetical protein
MNPISKTELQDLARQLLAKCERVMSPCSVEACLNVLDEDSWRPGTRGPQLLIPTDQDDVMQAKQIYFSELIA